MAAAFTTVSTTEILEERAVEAAMVARRGSRHFDTVLGFPHSYYRRDWTRALPDSRMAVFLGAVALVFLGGLGTTVGYHRAIAHRSLTLNPWARGVLIFFAMFNGSGAPTTWAAGHRLHHAKADTPEDISSPRLGRFLVGASAMAVAGRRAADRSLLPRSQRRFVSRVAMVPGADSDALISWSDCISARRHFSGWARFACASDCTRNVSSTASATPNRASRSVRIRAAT